MPEDELLTQGRRLTIIQQLEDLLTPAITAQQSYITNANWVRLLKLCQSTRCPSLSLSISSF